MALTQTKLLRQLPWGALAIFAGLWLLAINQLRIEWSINPQYAFGWSVPFLCLYLFWERWKTRPKPVHSQPSVGAVLGLVILALGFLPIRLVQEANPGWRLVSWAITLEVAGLTLGVLYLTSGWPWVKHFAFPVLFFLVAVPWPTPLETLVIQTLSRADAALTVEGLNWLGMPALQRGNTIEIGTGLVGIDEACSGIRSFQATLMIALFLGEFYRFDFIRRAIFVVAGSALAFLFNVVRTLLLVRIAYREGMSALDKWHDPAGITILVVCFFGLWLLATFLRRKKDLIVTEATALTPLVQAPVLPRAWLMGMAVWFISAELFTHGWYSLHETKPGEVTSWNLRWPADGPDFKELKISETVRAQLRFSEGQSGTWSERDGSIWQMFYFTWPRPRSLFDRVIVHNALSHRPEVCLPGIGMNLQADLGTRSFHVHDYALLFRRFVFESRGRTVHVFHCTWEEGRGSSVSKNSLDWTVSSQWEATLIRLRAVIAGRRYNGVRVLEIAVWGYSNEQEAEAAFQKQLERLLEA